MDKLTACYVRLYVDEIYFINEMIDKYEDEMNGLDNLKKSLNENDSITSKLTNQIHKTVLEITDDDNVTWTADVTELVELNLKEFKTLYQLIKKYESDVKLQKKSKLSVHSIIRIINKLENIEQKLIYSVGREILQSDTITIEI